MRECYGSLSYNGNVASTQFCSRKIFVLQIGVYISIIILKCFLLSLFSGPFVFSSGFTKFFSLHLKQYFVEFRICYLKYVSHTWVSMSVIGICWLVLHIPAALIPRNEVLPL